MDEIKVSVLCLAYNHEKYIRDALEGFVNQKTKFKYEVLINDDCSTDNTANIIKEYENKYPDLIKSVYQVENQYSKGVQITTDILVPKARGKYIALCEGDDYWINENKLQIQYDYMESNPECTFCFTNAILHNYRTNSKQNYIETFKENELIFKDRINISDIANAILPTATYFFPKSNFNRFPIEYNIPVECSDKKYELYSTLLGYAHYLNIKTSVYRWHLPNSLTTTWDSYTDEQNYILYKQLGELYETIDRLSNYLYHEQFKRFYNSYYKTMYLTTHNCKELKKEKFKEIYYNSNLSEKIKLLFLRNMPDTYIALRRFYKKIKKNTNGRK